MVPDEVNHGVPCQVFKWPKFMLKPFFSIKGSANFINETQNKLILANQTKNKEILKSYNGTNGPSSKENEPKISKQHRIVKLSQKKRVPVRVLEYFDPEIRSVPRNKTLSLCLSILLDSPGS